jgi:hypothetical protein
MRIIKSIWRKYFFKYTNWGKNGWSKNEMTDYYWAGK